MPAFPLSAPSPSPSPSPAPPSYALPRCVVPSFQPIRAGGGRGRIRLWTPVRRRRRAVAAGLAMAAAALAASAPRADSQPPRGEPRVPPAATAAQDARGARAMASGREATTAQDARDAPDTVRAPVRIADAAAVRLLRPGDRVDVLAADRVVAVAAPVVSVPADGGETAGRTGEGALIVLAVPRRTAAVILGAAASTPLAVTLC
ncbi:hypothetical protein ACIGXA_29175 [Streptomyces fildesensis]|uniref:Flp pilus assembly protein RcpC/CpaB domain-containing protein n=1 Tax=Streptomyces fildesensis TaxID=375757 RepID=A0ABW8CFJ6_9ACTN